MQWGVVMNVVMLIAVILTIAYIMQLKRKKMEYIVDQPILRAEPDKLCDEIISVRKITADADENDASAYHQPTRVKQQSKIHKKPTSTILLLLMAKENQQFVGYELLQTMLAHGLRCGEGQLFHKHDQASGQGNIVFSLAAMTESGRFDLQNIGDFAVKGLCVFMYKTSDQQHNAICFNQMLASVKQLSEQLNADVLDDKRNKLTAEHLLQYSM